MSHPAQVKFIKEIRRKFSQHFRNANIIDCGSKDINGSNRVFFRRCLYNWAGMNSYTGIDLTYGKNVDIVGPAHEILPKITEDPTWYLRKGKTDKPVWPIDIVISTEMLEHDRYWKESLKAMYDVLCPGGLLILTAGGDGREEHGTYLHYPSSSPETLGYYQNISNDMFGHVLPRKLFSEHVIRQVNGDFQFAGVKTTTIC